MRRQAGWLRKKALNPVCQSGSVGCCHSTAAVGQPSRAGEGGRTWQGVDLAPYVVSGVV